MKALQRDPAIATVGFESECSLNESPASRQIRVLIAEDHEPFRRHLCLTLQQKPNIQVVGELEDGLQAVRQAQALKPDMILLDIGLPGLNGLEVARQILELTPNAKIIFVTLESSLEVVEEALSLGACGYLVKGHVDSKLLAAIDAVSKGLRFVSDGLNGKAHLTRHSPRQ